MNRLLAVVLIVLAVACVYGIAIAFLDWRTKRWFK